MDVMNPATELHECKYYYKYFQNKYFFVTVLIPHLKCLANKNPSEKK